MGQEKLDRVIEFLGIHAEERLLTSEILSTTDRFGSGREKGTTLVTCCHFNGNSQDFFPF